MTRRRELFCLAAILLGAILLRMAFVHEPFERDEGLYAYLGQVILDGGLPYRDAIDHKPPGVHYIYALMISLGGANVEAIRILTALYSLGTVWFVYLTARLQAGVVAGLWAALACGIVASGPQLHGSSSNTEVFLLLPITAALYLLLKWRDEGRPVLLAWCGFCCGCAMLIKPVALPMALLFLVVACLPQDGRATGEGAMRRALFFLLPPILLGGAIIAYFALKGAWSDFWYWNLAFNRGYGAESLAGGHLKSILEVAPKLAEHLPLWFTAFPAIWLILRSPDLRQSRILIALIPATLLGVAMPGRYYPHYFLLLIPPLAILAGMTLASVGKFSPALRRLFIPLLGCAWLALVVAESRWYLLYTPEEVVAAKYPKERFVAISRLAAELSRRTPPGGTLFQWGFEPELYFLADRRAASRYTVDQFVGASPDPRAAAAELARDIATNLPRFVLVIPQGNTGWPGFLELMQVLVRFYALEGEMEGARLFRLKSGQEG